MLREGGIGWRWGDGAVGCSLIAVHDASQKINLDKAAEVDQRYT